VSREEDSFPVQLSTAQSEGGDQLEIVNLLFGKRQLVVNLMLLVNWALMVNQIY